MENKILILFCLKVGFCLFINGLMNSDVTYGCHDSVGLYAFIYIVLPPHTQIVYFSVHNCSDTFVTLKIL